MFRKVIALNTKPGFQLSKYLLALVMGGYRDKCIFAEGVASIFINGITAFARSLEK